LLERFGYKSKRGNNRKELHTTVSARKFNKLKGSHGFRIVIKREKVNLITKENEVVGYWDKKTP